MNFGNGENQGGAPNKTAKLGLSLDKVKKSFKGLTNGILA
jgi:hypothetical protein